MITNNDTVTSLTLDTDAVGGVLQSLGGIFAGGAVLGLLLLDWRAGFPVLGAIARRLPLAWTR